MPFSYKLILVRSLIGSGSWGGVRRMVVANPTRRRRTTNIHSQLHHNVASPQYPQVFLNLILNKLPPRPLSPIPWLLPNRISTPITHLSSQPTPKPTPSSPSQRRTRP